MAKSMKIKENFIYLFIFSTPLIFTFPEILMLLMAALGAIELLYRNTSTLKILNHDTNQTPIMDLVPFFFTLVFFFKLISMAWSELPRSSLNNAFNHIHFLLWPLIFLFFKNKESTLDQAERYLCFSMITLCSWYLTALFFFPNSSNATCFKAGAHDCGTLGAWLGVCLIWLTLAITRAYQSIKFKLFIFGSYSCAWIAFTGTKRRTELLGLIVGIFIIFSYRIFTTKKIEWTTILVTISLLASSSFIILDGAKSINRFERLTTIQNEVSTYFEGHEKRIESSKMSVGGRLEMYNIAFKAIQERPLLGWGAGIRPKNFPQFATDPDHLLPFSNFHNLYLQIVLEIGFIGFLIAMAIFIIVFHQTVIKKYIVNDKEVALIGFGLYFMILWKSLANTTFGYSIVNTFFVVLTAWLFSNPRLLNKL